MYKILYMKKTPYSTLPPFILASSSPRRRELLTTLGLAFEVIPPQVEELEVHGETPREHVARLSRAKAFEVAKREVDRWILGADTVVFIDGTILGKPKDEAEAYSMLKKISGREHKVITGFFIYHPYHSTSVGDEIESFVKVKALDEKEIKGYIKTEEPFDKAGAYAIQGIGMFMIEKVRGSYTNVIGLPVCEIIAALKQVGAIRLFE